MPNSASAEKSLRRSNVRRDRNRQQRGSLRTRLKKFRAFLAEKPTQEAADKEFSLVVKALDQAAVADFIAESDCQRGLLKPGRVRTLRSHKNIQSRRSFRAAAFCMV